MVITVGRNSFLSEFFLLFKNSGILLFFFCFVCVSILMPWHVYAKDIFCLCVLFFCGLRWKQDKTLLWLLIFSVTFALMSFINHNASGAEQIGYIVGPVAFYKFGEILVEKNKSEKLLSTFFVIMIVLLGADIYSQTFNNITSGVVVNTMRRMDDNSLSATLMGAIVSLGFVGVPYFISVNKPFRSIKAWLFVLLFISSILTILHLVNRTGLVIAIIAILATIYYKVQSRGAGIVILVVIMATLLILMVADTPFVNEFFSAYQSREVDVESSFATGGGRFSRWGDAIGQLFVHPFGWKTEYGYIHNFWLDVARIGGIIPFFAIVIATINGTRPMLQLYKIKDSSFIALLLALNICFFFTCLVEPIIEGVSTYVYLYFMLWGIQKRYCECMF